MSARRGGGPKTVEGKKKCAGNALKLGAYARDIVLPGEDPKEFERLLDAFVRDLRPPDSVGYFLVRDLAGMAWKRIRIDATEAKVIIDLLDGPIKPEEATGTRLIWRPEVQVVLPVLPMFPEHEITGCLSAIACAEDLKGRALTPKVRQEIEQESPYLDRILNAQIIQVMTAPAPSEVKDVMRLVPMHWPENTPFDEQLDIAIRTLQETVWLTYNKEAILQEYRVIQQRRILAFMERPSHNRIADDLRRSSAKILAEYRKYVDWQASRSAVDSDAVPWQPIGLG